MKASIAKYIVELLIVIFGVSIAFWLNEMSSEKKERKVRDVYLKEIKDDIQSDIKSLDYSIDENTIKIERASKIVPYFSDPDAYQQEIIEGSFDIGNLSFFTPQDFTYQSMIASGDFKLINHIGIKRHLIVLHTLYDGIEELEKNYIQALDDNYFPFLVENFDYTTFQPANPNFHKSLRLRNFFMYSINDRSSHINAYKNARKIAIKLDSVILVEIGRQLK